MGLAAVSGLFAAIASNPFFILKTRFQASSPDAALRSAVAQHETASVLGAFAAIGRADGPAGYVRGLSAFAPRVIVASAVQLSTYDAVKEVPTYTTELPLQPTLVDQPERQRPHRGQVIARRLHLSDGLLLHVASSFVTGVAVVGAMQATYIYCFTYSSSYT